MAVATLGFTSNTSTSVPFLGIYLVLGYWISRKWYLPAVVGFGTVALAEIANSDTPFPTAAGILIGATFSVVSGTVVGYFYKRVQAEEELSKFFEEQATKTSDEVRADLARTLHDSVVRDLSRISLISNASRPDSADSDRWKLVESLSLGALEKLRRLGAERVAEETNTTESPDFGSLVHDCQVMLSSHGIALETDESRYEYCFADSRAPRVLSHGVLEACTNVAKYAPRDTVARLTMSTDDGQLSMLISNDVHMNHKSPHGLSGGLGISALSAEASLLGGSVHCWTIQNKWFFALQLPLDNEKQGGNSRV